MTCTLFAWGRGEDGQLGVGDKLDQFKPRLVVGLDDEDVAQVACGSGHTVALSLEGKVFAWGRGDDGRLGHGDHEWKDEPMKILALDKVKVVHITCGSYHTAAVSDSGCLYTWGGGMYGKLGHCNETGYNFPKRVDNLRNKFVVTVACGSRHTMVLCQDTPGDSNTSEVLTWGDTDNGVSGHGESSSHQHFPKSIRNLQFVVQIAACGFHSAALTYSGDVYTWGEGKFGRLGHGTPEINISQPKKISTFGKIVQISCGGFHTAAVSESGKLFTFGGGEHGQLGHGTKDNHAVPTMVESLKSYVIVQVTCGWSHSVALTDEGHVYSFGNGDHGKLAQGNKDKLLKPTLVLGFNSKHVTQIASYNEHTAAIIMPPGYKSSKSVLKELGSMVNDPLFSDVTFMVEGKLIYAHRVILGARSDHFRAMFTSGFREATDNVITIDYTSYDVFLVLLGFLYSDVAEVSPEMAIDLYSLADIYALAGLAKRCIEIVRTKLTVKNAPNLLNIANHHGVEAMINLCKRFIIRNFEVVTKSEEFAVLGRDLILEILKSR